MVFFLNDFYFLHPPTYQIISLCRHCYRKSLPFSPDAYFKRITEHVAASDPPPPQTLLGNIYFIVRLVLTGPKRLLQHMKTHSHTQNTNLLY